ncbi:hypothetical protein HY095_01375 [Candidatus Micrarchaeota archaeon]|nr:hypothetical protein [Candidatus Micrarchaeota archaeon]
MNIIGVYPHWAHDTCAALVRDGKLVAAVEEERFTRRKHSTEAPVNSIKYCLSQGGISMQQVDCIAVPWHPGLLLKYFASYRDQNLLYFGLNTALGSAGRLRSHKAKFRKPPSLKELAYYDFYLKDALDQFAPLPPIRYYEHHRAHAATAFYLSGWKDSSIITVDGAGELNATVSWKGTNGNSISKMHEEPRSRSLGDLYSIVSEYLNIGWAAEGKTMGLAPYGKPDGEMNGKLYNFIDPRKGRWFEGRTYDGKLTPELMGFPPRPKDIPVTSQNYANLAYAVQTVLEEAMVKVARDAVGESGSGNICLAGGVALNCTTNSVLLNSDFATDVFVFPAANDGGSAVGAALECAAEMGEAVSQRLEHAYWGPSFPDEKIEAVLRENRVKFEKCGDASGEAAEAIAGGKVIGWFQGRMELGPRALGNRSILADPTRADVWERVNEVKLREKWRPLAPSMLYEARNEYLEKPHESPFMILAFQVPEGKRKEIPAVVHVDGSTRPQTVKREVNEPYWKLIKSLESINGTPVVLNTSFNVGPEPVVCTPQDALRTFYTSQLDELYLGGYAVRK